MTNLMYLGRSVEDIAAALIYWDNSKKQETKMTRLEAERKLAERYSAGDNILDALEALGLIKFDEENRHKPAILRRIEGVGVSPPMALEIYSALNKHGYLA